MTMIAEPTPSRSWMGTLYRRGPIGSGGYALTFDDGPTPGGTERVLDQLAKLKAPATFFVIGMNVEKHPDLLRRIHAEGHLVGNHTWRHAWLGFLRTPGFWREELARTDAIIESIIGRRPAMFRPPLGFRSPVVMRTADENGQRVIMWSQRAMDGVKTTSRRILSRLNGSADGDVLLLHDGMEPSKPRDPTPTIDALGELVGRLADRGLRPLPLDQLLRLPAYAGDSCPPMPSVGSGRHLSNS
jgi:peptidoglycan/xylan/chitin deacetylase (PgdA/CDA1 family)